MIAVCPVCQLRAVIFVRTVDGLVCKNCRNLPTGDKIHPAPSSPVSLASRPVSLAVRGLLARPVSPSHNPATGRATPFSDRPTP